MPRGLSWKVEQKVQATLWNFCLQKLGLFLCPSSILKEKKIHDMPWYTKQNSPSNNNRLFLFHDTVQEDQCSTISLFIFILIVHHMNLKEQHLSPSFIIRENNVIFPQTNIRHTSSKLPLPSFTDCEKLWSNCVGASVCTGCTPSMASVCGSAPPPFTLSSSFGRSLVL